VSFLLSGCGLFKPNPKPLPNFSAPDVRIEGVQVGNQSRPDVEAAISQLALHTNVASQAAKFDDDSGQIIAELPGKMINVKQSADRVMTAAAGADVTAVYSELIPLIKAQDLRTAQKIGGFATQISDYQLSAGRTQNIRQAARLINNAYIESGNEFSFNRRVGEPTEERGFKPAKIFGDGGRIEVGIGGGICQVSSTLYNAVLTAQLPITERHPHSQAVDYVPCGKDATTYTDKDFRFQNSRRHGIIIKALQPKDQVLIEIYELPTK
jgi:vancomycin resistance protein YoaR